jgi:peroxiredoxin
MVLTTRPRGLRRRAFTALAALAALALGLASSSAGVTACGRPAAEPDGSIPPLSVVDPQGKPFDLRDAASRADFTVIEFFSAHCPCQRAHDARLRALYEAYAPRGVQFLAVDAETGASIERTSREASARRYPYPLLADPRGAAADALGAEFATYTVVVDRAARVRYAGGIDSDRSHLTGDAELYVRDALDDLLAGRAPRVPRGEALGCSLVR